jgi:hypothetical protein
MSRGRAANDYGARADRSNRMHRPAILTNYVVHWVSSLIVLGISAYFIGKFLRNTHLVYWLCLVSLSNLSTIA